MTRWDLRFGKIVLNIGEDAQCDIRVVHTRNHALADGLTREYGMTNEISLPFPRRIVRLIKVMLLAQAPLPRPVLVRWLNRHSPHLTCLVDWIPCFVHSDLYVAQTQGVR